MAAHAGTIADFWRKTEVSGNCVVWSGYTNHKGYGRLRRGRRVFAHKYSYEQALGPVPDGKIIMHTCDNPACVKLQHLDVGTIAQNNTDMVAKDRHAQGSTNGASKLDIYQVTEIRLRVSAGEKQVEIAREFSVSPSLVSLIVKGEVWK